MHFKYTFDLLALCKEIHYHPIAWFIQLREHLLGLHADNVKLLEHLQSAVFNVALDERCPADQTEVCKESGMLYVSFFF